MKPPGSLHCSATIATPKMLPGGRFACAKWGRVKSLASLLETPMPEPFSLAVYPTLPAGQQSLVQLGKALSDWLSSHPEVTAKAGSNAFLRTHFHRRWDHALCSTRPGRLTSLVPGSSCQETATKRRSLRVFSHRYRNISCATFEHPAGNLCNRRIKHLHPGYRSYPRRSTDQMARHFLKCTMSSLWRWMAPTPWRTLRRYVRTATVSVTMERRQ